MNTRIYNTVIILVSILLLSVSQAQAHKVRVFAYESGGEIIAEAEFSSGRPAKNAEVSVESADGMLLLSGKTDENGIFRFPVPAGAQGGRDDLTIVVNGGEGHRGTWLLNATDYLAADASPTPSPQEHSLPVMQKNEKDEDKHFIDNCSGLEVRLEKLLARELAPIKRTLAENQEKKVDLRDILGALGYIFGLAGLAFYHQAKRKGKEK